MTVVEAAIIRVFPVKTELQPVIPARKDTANTCVRISTELVFVLALLALEIHRLPVCCLCCLCCLCHRRLNEATPSGTFLVSRISSV